MTAAVCCAAVHTGVVRVQGKGAGWVREFDVRTNAMNQKVE